MKKTLIILRGIPGSGKSTWAKRFVRKHHGIFDEGVCWTESADKYFVRPDGLYDWTPKLLGRAHKWCRDMVEHRMKYGGTTIIIVDNTNTRKKEYKAYLQLAEKYGYEVREKIIGKFDDESIALYGERNSHNVPPQKVKEMAERFEHA